MLTEKEITAPDAPTAIGAEQSNQNFTPDIIAQNQGYFNPSAEEIFEAQMQYERENSPSYMEIVSMPELYEIVYPAKPPIIDGFLYNGTYLFVGSPKVGKSFMMAQIAYHVSSGKPMWNNAVRKGTVLYLALEDDYRRLQERLYRMFGTETTSNLFFSVASNSLNGGLIEQLDGFIHEHHNTSLIIIDTLQKIRESEGDTYSYSRDYDIIAQLKAFSDKNNICLLLVHHTRKQKADDNFDTISGTNGLLGAADGAFVMYKSKRTDTDASIEISGRDQSDRKILIKRNTETLCWDLDKIIDDKFKVPPEPLLEKIAGLVNEHNPTWQGTATELLSKLEIDDIKPNILSLKLNVNAGRLYTEHFIKYVNKRSHGVRRIELKYDLDHPIINIPDDAINQPVDYGEMMITADNVDEIAGADYDERHQDMINNCLG
ncbi:MAG: helicase RepA family protein [Ruminococcus sp.]|nr:helicase RepA family protein [Ruminococcus sp.]